MAVVTLRPAIFGIAAIGLLAAAMLPAVFARRDPLPSVGQVVELRAGVVVCATKAGSEASETEESPLRGCVLTQSPQVATVEAVSNGIARISQDGRTSWTAARNLNEAH